MPTLQQQRHFNPWLLVGIAASILLITSGIRLSLGLFVKPIANIVKEIKKWYKST